MANSVIKGTKVNNYINGVLKQKINGNVCCVNINGILREPIINGQVKSIANLSEALPSETVYGICAVQGGAYNKYCLVGINAQGSVAVYNYSGETAEYLFGNIPYIIG